MKALVVVALLSSVAHADDDYVIFARGQSLMRVDGDGRHEAEVATLDANKKVRALRTDAAGTVLLADVGGTWAWMPLDGSTKSLSELPCADGPAQLTEDGSCVVCRAAKGTQLYNFKLQKAFPLDVPTTRIVGPDKQRKLVWADAGGIWMAPVGNPKNKTQVAPQAPLRAFSVAPDGSRALGVFADEVFTDAHHKKSAEILENLALDGKGMRRKSIQGGVPVDWTHDAQWTLVQDGAQACIQRAMGGEYKCWKGYTVISASPTGKWVLVLGNRDRVPQKKAPPAKGKPKPVVQEEPEQATDGGGDEDVAVALPTGPLALYKGDLEGAFTNPPVPIVKVVDGAAVWVPRP